MKHARSAAALAFLPAPQILPAEGDHWGHEGATGPDAWATLDPASKTCAEGTHQSPIDLSGAVHGDMGTIAPV